MAKTTSKPAHEIKLLKAKDALEEAKVVLYNARIDFSDAKREFIATAKAQSKKLIESMTKKGK